MSLTRRWLLCLAAIVSMGGYALLSDRATDDSELVNALRSRAASKSPKLELAEEDVSVKHLTSKVMAEKRVVAGAWVVHQRKSDRPRLVLPFASLANGPSAPETDLSKPHDAVNQAGFLGASACAECHLEKHQGFVHTAHHRTSGAVTVDSVLGSLVPPANELISAYEGFSFKMRETDKGVVQTAAIDDWKLDIPMDLSTGSGKVAQTFLYWDENRLFESYVSYFKGADQWLASPGFQDDVITYARAIEPACLECHVTYIESTKAPNHYAPSSAILGISCERCHGPGKAHVEFHARHPDRKEPRHIILPSALSRDQQLDICGQCHAGSFDLRKAAFSFRPGDDLGEFHQTLKPDFDDKGIHTSNQLARLRMSKCFIKSEMTCTACHDPHVDQRGDTEFFRQACLNCHQSEHCKMRPILAPEVADRCVECHMPVTQIDDLAGMKLQGLELAMADHFIRVDESVAEEISRVGTDVKESDSTK